MLRWCGMFVAMPMLWNYEYAQNETFGRETLLPMLSGLAALPGAAEIYTKRHSLDMTAKPRSAQYTAFHREMKTLAAAAAASAAAETAPPVACSIACQGPSSSRPGSSSRRSSSSNNKRSSRRSSSSNNHGSSSNNCWSNRRAGTEAAADIDCC